MKKTFWFKFAIRTGHALHVFGATALVVTVLALCGVPMTWWIGSLCVAPGWLIVRGLTALANHEEKKMKVAFIERHVENLEKLLKQLETDEADKPKVDCRFREEGQCTYGNGAPECVKEKGNE